MFFSGGRYSYRHELGTRLAKDLLSKAVPIYKQENAAEASIIRLDLAFDMQGVVFEAFSRCKRNLFGPFTVVVNRVR